MPAGKKGFQKGKSGNPRGRPRKGQSWGEILKKVGLETIGTGKNKMTKMEAVSRKLWAEAARGESWAIKELIDRMDGKPQAYVDHTSDGKSLVEIKGDDANI